MGRETLLNAQSAILSWGLKWYSEWLNKCGDSSVTASPSCQFEPEDVQLSQANPNLSGHIHHVRYTSKTASSNSDATAEVRDASPLVCLHGFGTGIGQFATALPIIRAGWKGPVFALDSFGCGLSSRPKWNMGFGGTDEFLDTVEAYFIDPLEAWRIAMGIERMVLLGHSLGGYLAVCYALRFPEHVERLILVSPVGIPQKPSDIEERLAKAKGRFRVFLWFWNRGWSPFTAVKILGRRAMKWYTNRRYKRSSWIPVELLTDYLYRNWTSGKNSGGGYVQNTLLQPGAWARRPMINRMPALKVSKVSFVYGIRDWMDSSSASELASAAPALSVEMVKVADGGHNMMFDNPVGFAEAVLSTGSNPDFGHIYGDKFLLRESGRSLHVGDEVQCKRGSRKDWTWERATIVADHDDGTFTICWQSDNEQTREGGHLMRYTNEIVSNEQHVGF